jgi:phenylalanyl-tRNA synthetase beta chain
MKISCNALKKYIKNSADIDFYSVWDKFTIRTAEVEGVAIKGKDIDGVVVGEITECLPHPKSKKLHLLKVDIGKEVLDIVCGAPNARVGIKTAVITVGGHLGDITISVRNLVGYDSHGMCCSAEELGFADHAEGIIELPNDYINGKNIKEYLPELDDIIVEIDNKSLTNRPDLWGHYGIAREIAAITNHELLPLALANIPNDQKNLKIKNNAPDLCYRYTGIKLTDIKNNTTPVAMQIFLYYVGMRSISLLVDLTNYVMLELGQPMHAFDARIVKNIEIGLAQDGDTFTTLDGEIRHLTNSNLMIKNGNDYFAIAGVMGGLNSEIMPDTDSIVLESATFDAASIRKTAISLGLRTEASARYEKSLDPNMTEIATKRFISLLQAENPDLVIASNLTDLYPKKLEPIKVELTKTKLNKYMGITLSDDEVVKILTSLSFKVKVNKDKFVVTVPTYRATKDITMDVDLIEEIARIYGYENFETTPLNLNLTFKEHENNFSQEYDLKRFLSTKYNLSEVHTYLWYKTSFLNSLGIAKDNVKLLSKAEDNILRDDLIISLLEVAQNNLKVMNTLGIYEIGSEIINNECHKTLGIVLADTEDNIEKLYYQAKAIVANIFNSLKDANITFVKEANNINYYNKDYHQSIYLQGKLLGNLNIVDTKIAKKLSKKTAFVTISINMDDYIALSKNDIVYEAPSKYPEVALDYTIIVGKDDEYQTIANILNNFKSPIIKKRIFIEEYKDVYEKRYTIRYIVGSLDRTLTNDDLAEFKQAFIKYIKDNKMGIVE